MVTLRVFIKIPLLFVWFLSFTTLKWYISLWKFPIANPNEILIQKQHITCNFFCTMERINQCLCCNVFFHPPDNYPTIRHVPAVWSNSNANMVSFPNPSHQHPQIGHNLNLNTFISTWFIVRHKNKISFCSSWTHRHIMFNWKTNLWS